MGVIQYRFTASSFSGMSIGMITKEAKITHSTPKLAPNKSHRVRPSGRRDSLKTARFVTRAMCASPKPFLSISPTKKTETNRRYFSTRAEGAG
jgi:ribosomal protein S30